MVTIIVSSGACEHRQRDVLWASRSRWLRCVLQPPGGPRPLLRHRLQLLRGHKRGEIGAHSEGHLVSATGAAAAYCVALLPSLAQQDKRQQENTLFSLNKHFVEVLMRLIFDVDVFSCMLFVTLRWSISF